MLDLVYTVKSSLFLVTLTREVLSGVTTGCVEFNKFVSKLPKSWADRMVHGTLTPVHNMVWVIFVEG